MFKTVNQQKINGPIKERKETVKGNKEIVKEMKETVRMVITNKRDNNKTALKDWTHLIHNNLYTV